MSDPVDSLYQDRILQHYRHPCHSAELDEAETTAEGFNPTCGDRVRLKVQLCDNHLQIKHHTTGCAVCVASSSIMASELNGKASADAESCIKTVLNFLGNDQEEVPDTFTETDVAALSSVKPFPMRLKCATLPWTVLLDNLEECGSEN